MQAGENLQSYLQGVERNTKNLHSNANKLTNFMMTYFLMLHTIYTKARNCHVQKLFINRKKGKWLLYIYNFMHFYYQVSTWYYSERLLDLLAHFPLVAKVQSIPRWHISRLWLKSVVSMTNRTQRS